MRRMKKFIESERLKDALRELCVKYSVDCSADSLGLGRELMELPDKLNRQTHVCETERTTEALDVLTGNVLTTMRGACCKETIAVSTRLWNTAGGVCCPKCGRKIINPKKVERSDSDD